MTKRRWIGIGLLVIAIAAVALLVLPWFTKARHEASPAPNFSSVAVIDHGRVVLPPVAGGPAAVYFDISNRGKDTLFITSVGLGHGRGTELADTSGVGPKHLSNVPINPGETVRLGAGTGHVALTGYDSTVVPGAGVKMVLAFQNGQTVTAPATVDAAPGTGGAAGEGAKASPPPQPAAT